MKSLHCIFAFYLILLATVPCCIADDCGKNQATEQRHDKNSDGDCGNCSPFFSCQGCATGTDTYQGTPFEIIPLRGLPVYAIYIESLLPHVDYDFWQPPKLG